MGIERITTITSAASSYDLTTLSLVKGELGLTTAIYDETLALYISAESAKIAAYCNRVFPEETVSDVFRLSDSYSYGSLRLSRFPVGTITSVTCDDETLTASDYTLNGQSGILFNLCDDNIIIPWNYEKVTVVYKGGYATIPAAVADACVQMCVRRFLARGQDSAIQSEEISGVASVRYFDRMSKVDGFPSDIESLLAPYRNLSLL